MKTTGGSAFPHLVESCQRINETEMYSGLTIRDYFAATVMSECVRAAAEKTPDGAGLREVFSRAAAYSFVAADAMLAERDK